MSMRCVCAARALPNRLAGAEEELPPLPVGPGTLLVAGEQRLAAYRRLLRAWLDVEGVAPLPATDRLAHGAARLNLDRLVQALVARRAALVQEWMARSIKCVQLPSLRCEQRRRSTVPQMNVLFAELFLRRPLAQVVNLSLLEDPAANLLSLAAANGKLCGELCGECMLRCALPAGHDGEHGCGTAHKCEHACVFCAANHVSVTSSPAPAVVLQPPSHIATCSTPGPAVVIRARRRRKRATCRPGTRAGGWEWTVRALSRRKRLSTSC